jgi:hypothetical protein
MNKKDLPQGYIPSVKDAEWFINYWKGLPSYSNHESSLNKLFKKLCAKNDNIEDILIKCSSLNDFYSTNIFDVHTVAQHILSLNIDGRLVRGDRSLVDDIAHVKVNGKDHFFYSFATKYCSHHQQELYAIYDNYVEKVLLTMKERERFAEFNRDDLKDYEKYMDVIEAFQQTFGLTQYNIKQLDQYLWQLGKWYFNNYGLIYKYYNREDENPYPADDIRNKFWEGEMVFVTTHQKVGEWKEVGKSSLKCANEDIRSLAARLTPEQFGLVVYISKIFGKRCPYNNQEWIINY